MRGLWRTLLHGADEMFRYRLRDIEEGVEVNALEPQARLVYRGALLIFVVTILIGILNGLDVWDPTHQMILTHVHAGTLGWITLSVVASALAMFGEGVDAKGAAAARNMTMAALVTVVLYVAAFATTTGIFRPVAGTLLLIVIIWALTWVAARYRASEKSTAQLALYLAVISLTIGAILGILLGIYVANGSLPGLSDERASALAGAHPAAMLIGYLILAGVAISHWVLKGGQGIIGRLVAWALFVAGLIANIAFIFNIEPLIQVFSLLQVIAIIAYVVHMWGKLTPQAWSGESAENFGRAAVIGLVVGIGLLVYVVVLVTSGELNPESGDGPIGVLIAFDHAMFIGVMTNALFAAVATRVAVQSVTNRIILAAVNFGLALFLIGLATDQVVLKRLGTPIMGVALLYAITTYWQGLGSSRAAVS